MIDTSLLRLFHDMNGLNYVVCLQEPELLNIGEPEEDHTALVDKYVKGMKGPHWACCNESLWSRGLTVNWTVQLEEEDEYGDDYEHKTTTIYFRNNMDFEGFMETFHYGLFFYLKTSMAGGDFSLYGVDFSVNSMAHSPYYGAEIKRLKENIKEHGLPKGFSSTYSGADLDVELHTSSEQIYKKAVEFMSTKPSSYTKQMCGEFWSGVFGTFSPKAKTDPKGHYSEDGIMPFNGFIEEFKAGDVLSFDMTSLIVNTALMDEAKSHFPPHLMSWPKANKFTAVLEDHGSMYIPKSFIDFNNAYGMKISYPHDEPNCGFCQEDALQEVNVASIQSKLMGLLQ